MIAVVCILILAALFFIISGFLYGGKGSWLIAGFGTSSREERANMMKRKCAGQWVLSVPSAA